jgi:hypothetical protein
VHVEQGPSTQALPFQEDLGLIPFDHDRRRNPGVVDLGDPDLTGELHRGTVISASYPPAPEIKIPSGQGKSS